MNANAQSAVTSYLTDMLALEEHLEEALAGQIQRLPDASTFRSSLKNIHRTCETHIVALQTLAEHREQGGQGLASALKSAAATVLGMGAAAIDMVRTEELPKNLRDDYAAISLCTIGYVMLHTTAMTLDDEAAATLAKTHLHDHAECVMTLQRIIPESVVAFLETDGLSPRRDVLEEIHRTVHSAWSQETSDRTPHAFDN